jgi:plastocyanin
MTRGRALIVALVVVGALAALFVPRAVGNAAPAATGSGRNFNVSIVNDGVVTKGVTCSSEFCYAPQNTTIRQEDSVTWTNMSTSIHTVTICTPAACSPVGPGTGTDPGFTSGIIGAGGTFNHQFVNPGTYNYYCQIHGYVVMHGTITVAKFAVGTSTLPPGTVGHAYSVNLTTLGGTSPYRWTLTAGRLPAGLKLGPLGKVSGTPTKSGTTTFTVKVTDSSPTPLSATKKLTLAVS